MVPELIRGMPQHVVIVDETFGGEQMRICNNYFKQSALYFTTHSVVNFSTSIDSGLVPTTSLVKQSKAIRRLIEEGRPMGESWLSWFYRTGELPH